MVATMRSASPAAKQRRRAKPSVLHRFIDQLLYCLLNGLALRGRLLQQDEKHVLLAVDHEIAATGAVPLQFAERTRRRRLGVAGIGADRETEPEAEAIAGEIEVVAPDAGTRAYMIRGHQFEGLGAQIGLALELAAIEQHLRKAREVRHGRNHPAARGLPLLRNLRVVLTADPEIAVVRHRLGDQLLLLRIGDEKAGILHAERIEQLFPLNLEQGFSRYDLHDPRQDVGVMAVWPGRPRLVVQR